MDDNEYPPDSDYRPHLNLERHLTVGPHVYQITASGTGDERVGLTLVGWNPAGEVVSEISGGISPADLTPVADALTSTLAGLAALRRQRLSSAPGQAAAGPLPKRHRNQGVRWSAEDDERLAARHRAGAGPKELMGEFGRSRGGIVARLEHLGLIAADGSTVRAGRSARASAEGSAEGRAEGPAEASVEAATGAPAGQPARAPMEATTGLPVAAPAGAPMEAMAGVPTGAPAAVPAGVRGAVPIAVGDAGAAGEVAAEAA